MPRQRAIGTTGFSASARVAVLACALALNPVATPPAVATSTQSPPATVQKLLDSGTAVALATWDATEAWLQRSYAKRPAVVVGLSALLLLPVLALAGLLMHGRTRRDELDAPAADTEPATTSAWLDVDGAGRIALPPRGRIFQIGGHDDNDICLANAGIEHYHAVIERSPSAGFVILDVSGPDGAGLLVNGERQSKARLASGDVVELGSARMRFAVAA